MASTVILHHLLTGEALTLLLYPSPGGDIANGEEGDAMVETHPYQYAAEVEEPLDGAFVARVTTPEGQLQWMGFVQLRDGQTCTIDDLLLPIEEAKADVHVTVGPLTADSPPDVIDTTIYARVADSSSIRIEAINDIEGNPLDLTSYEQLELIIETYDREDMAILPDEDLERINDGAGLSFALPADVVEEPTTAPEHHRWALRDTADGNRVLAGGDLIVRLFAAQDE